MPAFEALIGAALLVAVVPAPFESKPSGLKARATGAGPRTAAFGAALAEGVGMRSSIEPARGNLGEGWWLMGWLLRVAGD